jgi:hypothetical protein
VLYNFLQSLSLFANKDTMLAIIVVASYSVSYLPAAAFMSPSPSTSQSSCLTRNCTRHVVLYSLCLCHSESWANSNIKLASILAASYSLSYSPAAAFTPSSSTSCSSHHTSNCTHHVVLYNVLLSVSLCANNNAKLGSIVVTAYSLSYSPPVT